MTEFKDFFDHPALDRIGWISTALLAGYETDPDVMSFHEMLTDLARYTARHPECYSDMPVRIADALEAINLEVHELYVGIMREREKDREEERGRV